MNDKIKIGLKTLVKIIFTICLTLSLFYMALTFMLQRTGYARFGVLFYAILDVCIIALIWSKNRKKVVKVFACILIIDVICYLGFALKDRHDKSLIVKTDVNIKTSEYLPFDENSKIVRLDHKASLQLEDNLPIVDGAAAVFPVYSAFVNAVYPDSIATNFNVRNVIRDDLREPTFTYNNTVEGYRKLAEKKTDIFFGAYPSQDQIEYARTNGTNFKYTEIGKEGFVFFVNKKNPVDSLTIEQIKGIYSGVITNWKEVGGNDERIVAFQRNEGSGSQSMLKRLMDDTNLMKPPMEEINDSMMGIINEVSDYKNYSNSIGFSFRYYLETLIANPNVKMIKVNGVAPTQENITNGTYPITGSLYAVTYEGNPNENVQKLIDWILSDEGQEIIEKTGYARVK